MGVLLFFPLCFWEDHVGKQTVWGSIRSSVAVVPRSQSGREIDGCQSGKKTGANVSDFGQRTQSQMSLQYCFQFGSCKSSLQNLELFRACSSPPPSDCFVYSAFGFGKKATVVGHQWLVLDGMFLFVMLVCFFVGSGIQICVQTGSQGATRSSVRTC